MAPLPDTASGSPPFVNRSVTIGQWLDGLDEYDFGLIPPTSIVLHHTYNPTIKSWRGLASMKAMQGYYHSLGWSAGPHIYCAPDGIWLATRMYEVGVHARWCNEVRNAQGHLIGYSIGVEMVGDYTKARPSGAVWDEALAVMGGLCKQFGWEPREKITFHRYCGKPACPGSGVPDEWVWSEVEQWLFTSDTYTENSLIVGPPGCTVDQAIAYILRGTHGEYTEDDLRKEIMPAYWNFCQIARVDFCVAIAQMIHETKNMSSFWASRPQRNPAGIGVNGRKRDTAPPINETDWALNPVTGFWEAGVSFASWKDHSIPAHIGRLMLYAEVPQDAVRIALGQKALSYRDLPVAAWGSAPTLKLLGRVHNPSGLGWASPGTAYGKAIAAIANRLMKVIP